ncbi:hypothetical protein GCM10017691_14090 [Pseudonocardia petroleophila]
MLATSATTAALTGAKPSATSITEVIATGAPNPASASSSPPKQNATRMAWVRVSIESVPKLRRSTSKCPVATVMLNTHRALTTIHRIGNRPNTAPCAAADSDMPNGIPNPAIATTSAVPSPASAAQCARTRSAPSRTRTTASGRTETRADRPSPPTASGSCWYCARAHMSGECAPPGAVQQDVAAITPVG